MSAGILPDPTFSDHLSAIRQERHEELMRELWEIGTSPFRAQILAARDEEARFLALSFRTKGTPHEL